MLPRFLLLTDRTQTTGPLVDVVTEAVSRGCRAVVLREKDLAYPHRAALAAALRAALAPVGGRLIVAGPAAPEPTDGVPRAAAAASPPVRPDVVGRSCHTAAELAGAAAEGCDYAVVSPVYATASKP